MMKEVFKSLMPLLSCMPVEIPEHLRPFIIKTEIDKLIDLGDNKSVYKMLGCIYSNPKNPSVDELKCKKCRQLKIVRTPYSYVAPTHNRDCPPLTVGHHVVRREKISFACKVKDYISSRKALTKGIESNLEKVYGLYIEEQQEIHKEPKV